MVARVHQLLSQPRASQCCRLWLPIPALAAEVARLGGRTREVFEQHLRRIIEFIAEQFNEQQTDRKQAISTTALLAGAVLLARAVADETFSQEILGTCREATMEAIEHSSGKRE